MTVTSASLDTDTTNILGSNMAALLQSRPLSTVLAAHHRGQDEDPKKRSHEMSDLTPKACIVLANLSHDSINGMTDEVLDRIDDDESFDSVTAVLQKIDTKTKSDGLLEDDHKQAEPREDDAMPSRSRRAQYDKSRVSKSLFYFLIKSKTPAMSFEMMGVYHGYTEKAMRYQFHRGRLGAV